MSPILLFALCALSTHSTGQERAATSYPFLLRLETMTFDDDSCVLLRRTGEFHLEEERGEHTKVFEGTLSQEKLAAIQQLIEEDALRQLDQRKIHPPPESIILDELHIDVFRGDHWQDLFFPDVSSRRPFQASIAPLVRWLERLRKEPHREISEDEGKNNCQLPKRIVLKERK